MLHQNNDDLKSLVSETWNSVLSDCGASSTICGMEWFKQYKNSITESDKNQSFSVTIKNLTDLDPGKNLNYKIEKIPAFIGN